MAVGLAGYRHEKVPPQVAHVLTGGVALVWRNLRRARQHGRPDTLLAASAW